MRVVSIITTTIAADDRNAHFGHDLAKAFFKPFLDVAYAQPDRPSLPPALFRRICIPEKIITIKTAG